jgi:hypothetical protein
MTRMMRQKFISLVQVLHVPGVYVRSKTKGTNTKKVAVQLLVCATVKMSFTIAPRL